MKKTDFFTPPFLQIPYQLIEDEKLTPADRIVFGVIYWYQKMKDGKCFASNETIGKVAKVSSNSVQNCLDRLENRGFIKRIHKDGKEKGRSRDEIMVLIDYKKIPLDNGINEETPLDNGIKEKQIPLDNGESQRRREDRKEEDDHENFNSKELNIKIQGFIDLFKHVNPTYKNLFSIPFERKCLKELVLDRGEVEIEQVLRSLPILLNDKYAPTVTKPSQLKRKYPEVCAYFVKLKNSRIGENKNKVVSTF